jgi:serine beta-lactamase-like protein LACTB, mitochondrial
MKTTSKILLLAALIAWTSGASGQPPALALEKVERIEKAISVEMSRLNIPGMSAAVATGRQLRWMAGYGLADVENYVPAKAATVYRLASISKPITAVAVMQLVERGKIELDAPIQRYVPDYPKKQWTVTVRDLLCHQGGIRHYRDEAELFSTRHYGSLREALAIFLKDPLAYEPETRFLYSTYGYSLLGAAVEGVTDMKFADYVEANVFEPAGMHTARPDDVYEIIPNRARGYRKRLGGKLENAALIDTSNKVPGGGICATVEDIADFAIHVQFGQLLKQETVREMFTARKTRDGNPTLYGLGWYVQDVAGRKLVEHSGAQPGFRTLLLMLPDREFTVVLMANVEGVDLKPLALEIARIVLVDEQKAK